MSRALRMEVAPETGLRQLLEHLLVVGKVKAVITLTKTENDTVSYSLVVDAKEIERAVPLYPLMPANLGKILSRLTMRGGLSQPVAIVAKPCELRGFVEMVKRRQGCIDNMFFISFTCGGVFPLKQVSDENEEGLLVEYWGSVGKNEIHPNLRPACRGCVEFIPYTADVTLRLIGEGSACVMVTDNDRGEWLLEDVGTELVEEGLKEDIVRELRQQRSQEQSRLFENDAGINGLDGLIDVFGKCIGCHACSKACPICYCTLCSFESRVSEYGPADYHRELSRKRGVRIPPGTVYFHLGRMTHMAISCVGCGSCEDVCPASIPISTIFKKAGKSIQEMFGYVPGKNLSEIVPICVFDTDELREVEN